VASDSNDSSQESTQVLAALILLTLVSGVVDAVSYLGLGHVFVANMTGNVVLLGCAAAGAAGFSVSATLTSIAAFAAGAVVAGRVAGRISDRGRLLIAIMIVEAGLVGAAALIALLSASTATGWARYTDIAILAVAMGMRTGAVRRLGVWDLPTTVLTQTLAGLASDSTLAGGDNPRAWRRAGAVIAMLAGAAVGAVLVLHVDVALPLLVAAVLTAGTAAAYLASGAPVRATEARA
jgi:uncharacterized membrane protein YoaK (UPF0700 family)